MHESLYDEIATSGAGFDSHYSDLYFPVTEQTTAILAKWPTHGKNAKTFICQISRKPWYDVPFAYLPYWEERIAAGRARESYGR